MILIFSQVLVSYGKESRLDGSGWRDLYLKEVAFKIFSIQNRMSLLNYVSTHPSINQIIELIKEGQEGIALKTLQSLTIEGGNNPFIDETIFITALVNEALGFYPEAMGNLSRIIQYYPKTTLYRKALLRKAFINLIEGIRNDSTSSLKESGIDFYRIYETSDDPGEWEEALLGYGIFLYASGEYINAERVFAKIRDFAGSMPLYRFFRAENFMKINRLQDSKNLFLNLSEMDNESTIKAYMKMRLGDIAIREGKNDEGEILYKDITEDETKEEAYTMRTMALAELYMKKDKNREAIKILNGLLEDERSNKIGDTILFYLINLNNREGLHEEALSLSKELLDDYSSSPFRLKVRADLNKTLYALFAKAYKKGDFQKVVRLYYENRGYIRDRRVLLVVGKSMLSIGLPDEAIKVYKILRSRYYGVKDKGVSLGLAKGYIMKGNAEKARNILSVMKSGKKKELLEVAETKKLLGDLYLKKGEYSEALKIYLMVMRYIKDPELHLKTAILYAYLGQKERALNIYQRVVNNYQNKMVRERALLGLGDTYFSLKRWKNSLSAYKRVIKTLDEGEERQLVLYRIGDLNLILGDRDKAVKAWEEVRKGKGYLGRLAAERLEEVRLWKQTRM